MTRKAHLEAHLSSSELKTRYLSTIDKVERRRWQLLWLVSEKWTIKQAAKAVGINYDYGLCCKKFGKTEKPVVEIGLGSNSKNCSHKVDPVLNCPFRYSLNLSFSHHVHYFVTLYCSPLRIK